MTNLVVARFKGAPNETPRFTRTATIDELMKEVAASIPVDMIYFVVPHPDGKGFSLREAGLVILDVLQQDEVKTPQPLVPPALEVVHQNGLISQDTRTMAPEIYPMGSNGLDFKPKSQSELLAERGLEQAPKSRKKSGKAPKRQREDLPLPTTISKGGIVKTTGFRTATPAEAAAASQFGKH